MSHFSASLLIHPEELSRAWVDRCADGGIPILALHPVGGAQADESMARLLSMLDSPDFLALLDYAAQRGIKIEYEMHAMRYLLPASEFSEHPEWFRENEVGERVPDLNCCPSASAGLDFLAHRAADAARRLAKPLLARGIFTHRWFFWMDDARGGSCHCAKCRALSPSDQQLLVMNRILSCLREDDADASLAYLAYCDTAEVPSVIKPSDGIFLEFAPIDRDFHAPIAASSSKKNHAAVSPLPALLSYFGTDHAKVLEYWLDNSLYSGWTKPPKPFCADVSVISEDISYYRSLGFSDLSTFACYLGADYEALYGIPDISAFCAAIRSDG